MVITGNLPWFRGLLLLPSQLLGGIVAAALVKCMFPTPLAVNTTLANGTTATQGVFIEMFLTSLLVFTILMLAAEKHYATFMAPVGIGLALFVAMMAGMSQPNPKRWSTNAYCSISGVHWTGASLNPARSFGPAVATPYFPGYHYICKFLTREDVPSPYLPTNNVTDHPFLFRLVRPNHGSTHRRRLLPILQVLQVRGGQPWPGCHRRERKREAHRRCSGPRELSVRGCLVLFGTECDTMQQRCD